MEYVEPIRNIDSINTIKSLLRKKSQRDLLLFVLGINTGIRISDLLSLKVKEVMDETGIKEFLYIGDSACTEGRAYYLNSSVKGELIRYFDMVNCKKEDYLFKSSKYDQPISRQQAYRIINKAAKEAGIPGKIGTHTIRKTFGYHAYRKGIAISILMEIYHHHTPSETLKYLGINKNEKSLIRVDVNL
ncbi:tyrosine-type recombinase/integrase [Robertmurraya beringensis]|uniref:Tyrosine-type recombinase/integrase n=1 Tax=Robertmurraya beringensis TaxID=641660 RepID=A0ABV6KL32_9BACI